MKLLPLLALLLALLPVPASAAVVLNTYSDPGYSQAASVFSGSTQTVYLQATGLVASKTYHAEWFDSAGANFLTQSGQTDANGVFQSIYYLPSDTTVQTGTWRVDLYNWNQRLISTVNITVQPEALPEFSDVIGPVFVGLACIGIYWRKRRCARI